MLVKNIQIYFSKIVCGSRAKIHLYIINFYLFINTNCQSWKMAAETWESFISCYNNSF